MDRCRYRAVVTLAVGYCGVAYAQPPVHAVVTGDDAALTGAIAAHLVESGRYHVVSAPLPDCGARAACWRAALTGRGLDQAVFVDRVDEDVVGVRVFGADGDQRTATATLGDLLESDGIDALFFGGSTLHLIDAPVGTRVVIDSRIALRIDGDGWIRDLPSGKHAIELSSTGRSPRFIAVMLVPGRSIDVDAALAAAPSSRRLFPSALALGVAVLGAGAIAIASSADAPGVARIAP